MYIFAIYSTLNGRDELRKGGELVRQVQNAPGVNIRFRFSQNRYLLLFGRYREKKLTKKEFL